MRQTKMIEGYSKVIKVTCDICFIENSDRNWREAEGYTVIHMEIKTCFEDGFFGEYFDLCPNCYREHVVEYLKSLGATPTKYGHKYD